MAWGQENQDPVEILGPAPDGSKGGGALGAQLLEPPWGNSGRPLSPTIFNVVIDAVI